MHAISPHSILYEKCFLDGGGDMVRNTWFPNGLNEYNVNTPLNNKHQMFKNNPSLPNSFPTLTGFPSFVVKILMHILSHFFRKIRKKYTKKFFSLREFTFYHIFFQKIPQKFLGGIHIFDFSKKNVIYKGENYWEVTDYS